MVNRTEIIQRPTKPHLTIKKSKLYDNFTTHNLIKHNNDTAYSDDQDDQAQLEDKSIVKKTFAYMAPVKISSPANKLER